MMILGLSHVALATSAIEAATARLAAFGYACRFDEPSLTNAAEKRPLLDSHAPLHHIRALAAAPGSMAIELIDHGQTRGPQAADLIPVFRSASAPADWQPLDGATALPFAPEALPQLALALGRPVRPMLDPVLGLRLLWVPLAGDEPPGLAACALPGFDLAATHRQLTALRFRAAPGGALWSLLTPLPALQARLVPVPARPHPDWRLAAPLDAPGCACLALMARLAPDAALPAALQGPRASFTLSVNARPLRITLLRPAQGPVLELVESLA